jgi:predicted ester cyclase
MVAMSEANKALLQRHFDEVLNQGKLEVIDEIYAADYMLDAPVQTDGSAKMRGQTSGRDGLKRRVTLFRTAFPDIHFETPIYVTEGDWVTVQYIFSGTHLGQFRELAPTSAPIEVMGILIARVENGRIVSAVSVFDSGDMMRQLTVGHHHDRTRDFFHDVVNSLKGMLT